MKLKIILALAFLTLSISVSAQQTDPQANNQTSPDYVRPDSKTRQKRFVKNIFGPSALVATVASAGISTAINSPEEWHGTLKGFGRRVASDFATNAIKQTTVYALDESFELDSNFYRSKDRKFGAKFKNAFISPFTARTTGGRRVLGVPNLVGTYTANVIAVEAWYPKRYGYQRGLRNGTISLGVSIAYNLFREFIKK